MRRAVRWGWMAMAGMAAVGMSTAGCTTGSGTPLGDSTAVPVQTSSAAASPSSSPSLSLSPSATAAASGTSGPLPLACVSVTSGGTFASAGPGQVSLAQIGNAVGFQVTTAMPDTQSALGFHGYQGCRYTFSTPAGGGQLDVSVVIGADPTTMTNETAAQEFADTKAQSMPRSQRGCSGDCTWSVAATSGIGDSALTLTQSGGTVIVALKGDVYVEIGPGDFTAARETRLAQLLLTSLH